MMNHHLSLTSFDQKHFYFGPHILLNIDEIYILMLYTKLCLRRDREWYCNNQEKKNLMFPVQPHSSRHNYLWILEKLSFLTLKERLGIFY